MSGRAPPVFLQRQSYRRRRAMDALRLLPVLGVLLLAVPMLWPEADPAAAQAGGDAVPTSVALIYVFSVWGLLIAIAALFSVFLRSNEDAPAATEGEEGE